MDAQCTNCKARYAEGLNDFEYCASLHIEHPTLDSNLITQTLHLQPFREHQVGDARRTIGGKPLSGTYPSGYWAAHLTTHDGDSLATFLSRTADLLELSASVLRPIVDSGGRIECFIGLFATRLCDSLIPYDVLLRLGRLGIDIRLDYYATNPGNSNPEQFTINAGPT